MSAKRIPIVLLSELPECQACGCAISEPGWCPRCKAELVPVVVPDERVIEPEELRN